MPSKGRRAFLQQVGGLAGAGAVSTPKSRRPIVPTAEGRISNALLLRQIAAEFQCQRPLANFATNGDETLYPNTLVGTYGKGFLHNQNGEVHVSDYQTIVKAINSERHADFTSVALGYGRKQVNVESAFAYEMDGGDPHTFPLRIPPAFATQEIAAE